MNKFKVGDWVKHPTSGIGHVDKTFDDGSVTLYFINGKKFLLLNTDDSGIKEEIKSIKILKTSFDDFDSLFSEVEETRQFKIGDRVKTNRIIYNDEVQIKKNAAFTVGEIYNRGDIVDSYVDAIYENDFIKIDTEIYFSDIELYEEK